MRLAEAGIGLVARAELRGRFWGLLLLGVVAGLLGGIVLGAVALGERTATAYPRLVDAVHLDDARLIVPRDRPATAAALPRLPGVEQAWTPEAWVVQLDEPPLRFVSLIAGTEPHPDLLTPVIVDGRAPDPASESEVVVSERAAEAGLGLGTEIPVHMLSLRNMADFAVGFTPEGPAARLRVVGIARMPAWGQTLPELIAGPGFARTYAGTGIGTAAYVRFDSSPTAADRFRAAYTSLSAAEPSIVADYLSPEVELPRSTPDPAVVAAERALLVGLALFGLVVALGVIQVVGLGLLRTAVAARAARSVESALGMTTTQSAAARMGAALPAALVAGVLGAAVALAAGALGPLGSQARFEPDPGFRPQWLIAGAGGLVLATAFLLAAGLTALVAWRPAAGTADAEPVRSGSSLRTALGESLGRWPALLLGSRLVAGTRRGAPPIVAALVAAAAVAGIVATVTVGASLDRLVASPQRWAGGADAAIADAREPDVAALVGDPRVAALAVSDTSYARVAGGGTLGIVALTPRKGTPPVEIVAGRLPTGPDEVAVNPRIAANRELAVGDRLDLLTGAGAPHAMTVVGSVVVTKDDYGPLGQDLLVTPAGLAAVVPDRAFPQLTAHVYAVPGAGPALLTELGERLEVQPPTTPEAIRNLADLVRLPGILAVVLAVVAGTGLVHSLLVGARRLAREMAVFSVLGATPGQVRTTLGVLAAATAVPAVLLGVPVGLGVARLFWWQVTSAIGVGGEVAVPVGLIAVLVASVPLGAALVTAVPAVRFARTPAATALAAL